MAQNLARTAASPEDTAVEATARPNSPPGYELLDEIGRGGMGVVYRARDLALDRDVAVKLLAECYAPNSLPAQRFLSEARITGQLQHPGIPAVHQVGALANGRPFLAMKLIKGSTLEAILKQPNDPSTEHGPFVAVFEAVCQAVGYAHAHHVIHRDLKPANVMVGAFGEVQVMDWGLAKVLGEEGEEGPTAVDVMAAEQTLAWTEINSTPDTGSQTQVGSLVGTPAFIAPEQALGEIERVNERSDVFGLGALLTVILTGKPPYVGETSEAVRVQAARGKLENCFARLDGSGAEPELVALCKQCLAFEPADRPADAGAVAAAVAGLRAASDERARRAELERVRVEGEQATAAAQAAERRKRAHYTRVWNDEPWTERPWLDGHDCIDRMLATRPADLALAEKHGVHLARRTVCLDFDGVIHSYRSGWCGSDVIPDPPIHGTREAVARLRKTYRVVIHSSRCHTPEGRDAIAHWLAKHGIEVDDVCEHKPPALMYVDDRAIPFRGDWDQALGDIHQFRR